MCQQCHLQQDQGSIVHPTQGQATLIRLPRCSTVSDLVRQAPAATMRCHCLHLRPGTSSRITHLHHQSVPSSHRFFSQVTGGGDNPRGPWIKVRPALAARPIPPDPLLAAGIPIEAQQSQPYPSPGSGNHRRQPLQTLQMRLFLEPTNFSTKSSH